MTELESYYDILKVTRDAPDDVIRAAYRSLSQRIHPDKHGGDNWEATRLMTRINVAYTVLSDAEQRRRYDLQILQQQPPEDRRPYQDPNDAVMHPEPKPAAVGLRGVLQWIGHRIDVPRGHTAAIVAGLFVVVFAIVFWLVWMERQQADLFNRLAVRVPAQAADREPAADPAPLVMPPRPAEPAATHKPSEKNAAAAVPVPEPAPVAPAPAVPAAPSKESDYERLTAMLKKMGLGLHKLDAPAPAPAPAPALARPPLAEKPASDAGAAPASRTASAKTVPSRETDRSAVSEPARGDAKLAQDAGRTNAAPASPGGANAANAASAAAAAGAASAPRQAVIADARACAAPAYPKSALRNGDSGIVQLALLVASDGKVVDSKVQKSSGFSVLDKAALKALSQCTFKVAGAKGQGEPVWTMLDYVFSLD